MTEDEVVGWHHQLNGHEFERVPANGEGQGSLACCSPWGHKESDTTERLKNNNMAQNKNHVMLKDSVSQELAKHSRDGLLTFSGASIRKFQIAGSNLHT